jgi:hypothetical protein
MLLGEALDDLKKENTHRVIGGQLYRLDDKDNDNTKDVLHKPNDLVSIDKKLHKRQKKE